MATELNGRLVCLNVLFGKRWAAPLRYLLLALKTISLLIQQRPLAVLAQNPPIFCPFVLIAARRIVKFKLIVDHHAVWSIKSIRLPILSQIIATFERTVAGRANANTTPNANWTKLLQASGARAAFTYHDFVPRQAPSMNDHRAPFQGSLPAHRFLVIAAHGGHPEELLEKEVAAVQKLDGYLLAITGRRDKIGKRVARLSQARNMVYPGYLDKAHYDALKRQADVALSLSKEPNTVPHAISEFLAYGIPTVILKDDLLHSIFDGAVVEAIDESPESIRKLLKAICEDAKVRRQVLQNIDTNYEWRFGTHQGEISRLRQIIRNGS